jgi:hypothetical protein
MGLAGEVLALHEAVRQVMVIENRAGELHVADQAARNGPDLPNALNEHERDAMLVAPTIILGAASQMGNVQRSGELRIVGMLYERLGMVCVPLSHDSYLMAATSKESFHEFMNSLQQTLPSLLQNQFFKSDLLAINSAIDADQAVRSFFATAKLCEPNSIHMEDAILNASRQSWQVSGSYRPFHAIRSKRYYVELDAKTGAVTKFQVRS